VTALIIVLPVAAWLWYRTGELVPMLIMLAIAVGAIFVVPQVPHSPLACMRTGGHCGQAQTPWMLGLVVLTLCAGLLYKRARGDRRGVKGRRLP
jgi:hypothetical protein